MWGPKVYFRLFFFLELKKKKTSKPLKITKKAPKINNMYKSLSSEFDNNFNSPLISQYNKEK